MNWAVKFTCGSPDLAISLDEVKSGQKHAQPVDTPIGIGKRQNIEGSEEK